MREPELEEEALKLNPVAGGLEIIHQTLADDPGKVAVQNPSGGQQFVDLAEIQPGVWQGKIEETEEGYYHARAGDLEALALVGLSESREFDEMTSSVEILAPIAEASGGSVRRLADGLPRVRRVRDGGIAAGARWIGFPKREAYTVRGLRIRPLLPTWLLLLGVVAGLCLAWMAESGKLRDYFLRLAAWRTKSRSSEET